MFDSIKDILWAMNPKNRIWPPNHNDPLVKGPQPRILSYEAALELRRRQREAQGDETVEDREFYRRCFAYAEFRPIRFAFAPANTRDGKRESVEHCAMVQDCMVQFCTTKLDLKTCRIHICTESSA